MPQYKMIVLSNPVPGREDEYNDWYSNQHLGDVLKVPGVVAAQRFKAVAPGVQYGYVAIYELEGDNPQTIMDAIGERAGGDEMPLSEALDTQTMFFTGYEPITERLEG